MADTNKLENRSVSEIFMDHLALRREDKFELDLERNYDPHVVLISNHGNFHGHDGMRQSYAILKKLISTVDYTFDSLLIHGCGVAFEEWSAQSDNVEVDDGIDVFIIRNGKIIVQTVFYTVKPRTNNSLHHSHST